MIRLYSEYLFFYIIYFMRNGISHIIDKTSGRPRPDGGGGARHEVVGGADCLQSGF